MELCPSSFDTIRSRIPQAHRSISLYRTVKKPCCRRQRAREKTLTDQYGPDLARVVAKQCFSGGEPAAQAQGVRTHDLSPDGGGIAIFQACYRCGPAAVLVVAGEMEKQVADAGDLKVEKQLGAFVADAGERRYRLLE